MKIPASVLCVLVVGAAAAAQPPQRPSGLRVVVTPNEPVLTVGDTLRLRGEARDSAGRPVAGATVRFFGGSMEGTVDTLGLVKVGAPGSLIVNAVAAGPDGRPSAPTAVRIRIVAGPPSRVAISGNAGRYVSGQQASLGATVYSVSNDRRDDRVTWSSTAPTVATVNPLGRLTAVAPGRATITAAAGTAKATVTVDVVPNNIRRVEIGGVSGPVRTGDVVHLTASAKSAAGQDVRGVSPTWTMAPGSGLIDQDGAFVANEPGDYTVSASFGTASAQFVVVARPREIRRETTIVGRLPISNLLTAEFWPHPNGSIAYMSTIGDRLYALDISNPAQPRLTDSVVVDARHINDIMTTADGRYAVMTRENASSRRNGIVILSLENPAHPKVLSEFTETVTGGVHSTFVYTQPTFGTYVFLTDDATGSMRVIDLNDPKTPREVARWETNRTAGRYLHDIDIQNGLAYLSYWNDGLVILDVGNGLKGGSPTAPKLVSQFRYDLESLYRDVEAEGGPGYIRGTHTAWRHGDYVFVGDEVFSARPLGMTVPGLGLGKANGRLHVIDVKDIERPREVAWFEPRDGGVHNVWVAGDTLYVGDYQGGLRVVDISGELRGDLLEQGREMAHVHTGDSKGFIPNASMAWGAFYQKGLVWVNDIFSGLWIVKVEPKKAVVP